MRWFGVLLLMLLLWPTAVLAIAKYVDENGRVVFVDDESKIPARYLKKSQEMSHFEEPSDAEKAEQAQRLQEAREKKHEEMEKLRAERAEQERQKAYQTPVKVRGNQVLVPVRVAYHGNRVDVHLVLDTGASRTVFHRASLAALGVPADEGTLAYGVGAGGNKIASRGVTFESITVGPFKVDSAQAFVIDYQQQKAGYDGLLGMDFLRNLSYEIDYEKQIIRWQP